MLTITDTRPHIKKIDQQIIRLIADRRQLCEDARQEGGGKLISELETEQFLDFLEEGLEQELDEVQLGRLAKLIFGMCRGEE